MKTSNQLYYRMSVWRPRLKCASIGPLDAGPQNETGLVGHPDGGFGAARGQNKDTGDTSAKEGSEMRTNLTN